MTIQEIKNYFSGNDVYHYQGSLQELAELQNQSMNSYNYLIVNGNIYFAAEKPVNNVKAILI